MIMKLHLPIVLLIFIATLSTGLTQRPGKDRKKGGVDRPAPDLVNEKYGPHERNVLDFWKAKSDKPTPLVVYIHGGGFRAGSKEGYNPAALLAKGISAMAINYRLSPEVKFPAHYMDSARAMEHRPQAHRSHRRIGRGGDVAMDRLSR
jgi:acetyl esterase/lipase